jgi:hypothetical protein
MKRKTKFKGIQENKKPDPEDLNIEPAYVKKYIRNSRILPKPVQLKLFGNSYDPNY